MLKNTIFFISIQLMDFHLMILHARKKITRTTCTVQVNFDFFFIIKPFQLKMDDFSEFIVDAKDFNASEILMQFSVLNL